jgi:hypothetical protein
VVFQPPVTDPYYSGINPYALGFAMFTDMKRICTDPTPEDREWFPDIAGSDWVKTLDYAMRHFKDESFIAQYLSPRLMRELRLFSIVDDASQRELEVAAIHDDMGYRGCARHCPSSTAPDRVRGDAALIRFTSLRPRIESGVTRPSFRFTSLRPRIESGVTRPSFRFTSLRPASALAITVAGLASQTWPGPERPGKLRLIALTVTCPASVDEPGPQFAQAPHDGCRMRAPAAAKVRS